MPNFNKYVYIIMGIVIVIVMIVNAPDFFPSLFNSLVETIGSIARGAQDTAETLKETPGITIPK